MKIKTEDLSGPALDYAAAIASGYECFISRDAFGPDEHEVSYSNGATGDWHYHGDWSPTTRWAQGGLIIKRERIAVDPSDANETDWDALLHGREWESGPTPLIAAMRCYVASVLGDEVDIPDELT